jgi:hypothetical protein
MRSMLGLWLLPILSVLQSFCTPSPAENPHRRACKSQQR